MESLMLQNTFLPWSHPVCCTVLAVPANWHTHIVTPWTMFVCEHSSLVFIYMEILTHKRESSTSENIWHGSRKGREIISYIFYEIIIVTSSPQMESLREMFTFFSKEKNSCKYYKDQLMVPWLRFSVYYKWTRHCRKGEGPCKLSCCLSVLYRMSQ